MAAHTVIQDLSAGDVRDERALGTVMLHLRRYVRRVFRDLDADDIVQATIARLLARPERLSGVDVENAWAYLVGATRNASLDAIRSRSRRREVLIEVLADPSDYEDSVASIVDREATHEAVVEAFRILVAAGESRTVRILTTWLDMAEELGKAPSTRETAVRTGVSHTRVAQALKRLRDVLGERD